MKVNGLNTLYHLFSRARPGSGRIFMGVLTFLGILWYAVYTNFIIDRLQSFSQATTETYAQLIVESYFGSHTDEMTKHIVIKGIINDFDMPIIVTDMEGRPTIWRNITTGRFFWKKRYDYDGISFSRLPRKDRKLLREKVKIIGKKYKPKLIYTKNRSNFRGYLYYSDSNFISLLKYMPIFEAAFVVFIVFAVYMILRAFLVNEKSNLWVGLAKETAHQLGTPLTSLMGWIEYLKVESQASRDDDFGFGIDTEFLDKVEKITYDMEHDVARLTKVTNRFSQIGSKPDLKSTDLKMLLDDHITYFSKRIPTISKKITVDYKCDSLPKVIVSYDLLSWVFENLFKNALDAIEDPVGTIELRAFYVEVDRVVRIIHRDTGKGIAWEDRAAVFNPGYTTKKRGWGLGLTLAQRIIQEYHKGKIYISWSHKGKGTEFVIELPVTEREAKRYADAT